MRLLVALLSLVTASLAFTVSETAIGSALRERANCVAPWFGKLLSCGYCCGHWIAFVLVAVYRPRLFGGWEPLDLVLTALAVAWLAAFQWVALCWLLQRSNK